MPEGKKRLERAVKGALDKKTDKPIEFKGLMGAYVNGNQTIVVAERPDFVYVRIRGATGEVVQAFNDMVAEVFDLPVIISRDPKVRHLWRVTGRDIGQYGDWGGGSYLPPHGDTHTFIGAEGYGSDPVWIVKRQWLPFLPMPNPSGTNAIFIEQDYWYWEGRFRFWPGSGTDDLFQFRPTGGAHGRFVTIFMRGDEGIPDYLVGPEFSLIYPPPDPAEFILAPDPNVGIPICAVSLQTGTQNIGWNEIYDLRIPPSALPQTGSMIYLYDEGVPLGPVSSLDFRGELIEVIKSGSHGYVMVTGTAGACAPPVTGTFVLYDETVLLGSVDTLVIQGDNAEAIISGTTGFLIITGSAGVPNKILLYDQDIEDAIEYEASSGGFNQALTAAEAGDVIWIPPATIGGNVSIPYDVHVVGVSRNAVTLLGEVALGNLSSLESLSILRELNDHETTLKGVVNPIGVGDPAKIINCLINVQQEGSGSAHGISMEGHSDVEVWGSDVLAESRYGNGYAGYQMATAGGTLDVFNSRTHGSTAPFHQD